MVSHQGAIGNPSARLTPAIFLAQPEHAVLSNKNDITWHPLDRCDPAATSVAPCPPSTERAIALRAEMEHVVTVTWMSLGEAFGVRGWDVSICALVLEAGPCRQRASGSMGRLSQSRSEACRISRRHFGSAENRRTRHLYQSLRTGRDPSQFWQSARRF